MLSIYSNHLAAFMRLLLSFAISVIFAGHSLGHETDDPQFMVKHHSLQVTDSRPHGANHFQLDCFESDTAACQTKADELCKNTGTQLLEMTAGIYLIACFKDEKPPASYPTHSLHDVYCE